MDTPTVAMPSGGSVSKYLGFALAVLLAICVIAAITGFARFDLVNKSREIGASLRNRVQPGAAAN